MAANSLINTIQYNNLKRVCIDYTVVPYFYVIRQFIKNINCVSTLNKVMVF